MPLGITNILTSETTRVLEGLLKDYYGFLCNYFIGTTISSGATTFSSFRSNSPA